MALTFVKDQVIKVSTFKDLCGLLGVKKSGRHGCADFDETRSIWGPCIPKNIKSGWNNFPLLQNDIILEWNDNIDKDAKMGDKTVNNIHQLRITFRRYKNAYTFLGIYQLDQKLTKRLGVRVWERVDSTFTLN